MTQRQAEIPKRSRFQPRLARRTDQIHLVETTNPSLIPPHLQRPPFKMMSQSLRASVSDTDYRMRRHARLTQFIQRSLFTRASRQQVPVAARRTFLTSAVRRGMSLLPRFF
jgi:hypothetical protein